MIATTRTAEDGKFIPVIRTVDKLGNWVEFAEKAAADIGCAMAIRLANAGYCPRGCDAGPGHYVAQIFEERHVSDEEVKADSECTARFAMITKYPGRRVFMSKVS